MNVRQWKILAAIGLFTLTHAAGAIADAGTPDADRDGDGYGYGYGPMMRGYGPGWMGGYGPGGGPGMMGPGAGGGYGPGMMRGYGPGAGYGPGMMGGGYGAGMMGGGYGPGMMGGFGLGFGHGLQRALGLRDDQRAKLDAIDDELAAKRLDIARRMRGQAAAMREAISAEPRDRAAMEAAFARMNALRQEMFTAQLDARDKVDAVLTPEQRKAMRRWGPWRADD